MGAIEHLTISLPADVADSMRDRVAAGEFADISEVVLEALRDFEASDTFVPDERLKAKVNAAYDAWRRDPSSALPLKDVIAQLKQGHRSAK